MEMISVGPCEGGVEAFASELRSALATLSSAPKLVLVYLPFDSDHARFLASVAALVQVPVVGATTGGAAFTERGFSRTGAVAAILAGEDFAVSCTVARGVSEAPESVLKTAISAIEMRPGVSNSVLTLADAFACDGETLVSALRNNTAVHCRHFGGTAGDSWKFAGTRVFLDGEVLADAAVFVALYTKKTLKMAVHHGWCAAEGSREFRVTKIEGNVLAELDGRHAVAVYREELTRLGFFEPGKDLVQLLARYDLGVRTPFGEELKIRAPLAVGDDGAITLASSLNKGDFVRVVTTTPSDLIAAARTLAQRVLEPLAGQANGALVFDCAARLQLLGNDYNAQVEQFRGQSRHPLLGTTCFGEIAKFGGSIEGFHNTTAVMVAW